MESGNTGNEIKTVIEEIADHGMLTLLPLKKL